MDNLWHASVQMESANYEMRWRKEANFLRENPCEKIFPKSAKKVENLLKCEEFESSYFSNLRTDEEFVKPEVPYS